MVVFFSSMFVTPVLAQVDVALDVFSRYVWRGYDAGSSPSLQPDISYTAGNFVVGGWAAYATNGNPGGTEINFYASYTIETGAGELEFVVTDYIFPEAENFYDGASHYVELGVGYSFEKIPLSLFLGTFVLNDDDYSTYIQAEYSLGGIDLLAGFTPTESALYGNTKPAFINLGIGTSREITVTDTFSFTLSSSLILNPLTEDAFFLVGFSF